MAKAKNAYLARVQAQQAAACREQRLFTIQQSKDMAIITLGREFGFGPDRIKRFSDAYDAAFGAYVDLCLSDAADDRDIWYTKAKLDGELAQYCGEHFIPWDERYKI